MAEGILNDQGGDFSSGLHGFENDKELFARVTGQSPALLLITDGYGRIEYVNPRFESVFKCQRFDLLKKNIRSIFRDQVSLQQKGEVLRKIRKGECYREQLSLKSSCGKQVILETGVSPVHDARGRLCNILFQANDITRESRLLQQLQHLRKLESVEGLISSITHDFGNPLLGIRFVLRDLQKRQELAESDQQLLAMAESECARIQQLIKELRRFIHPASGQKSISEFHSQRSGTD